MGHLIKKEQITDNFLGKPIEIIHPKSKYLGFRGWIDAEFVNDKYKIMLPPAAYEHTNKHHIFYIDQEDIYKWVNILQPVQKKEEN